jgi:hypothetical protein
MEGDQNGAIGPGHCSVAKDFGLFFTQSLDTEKGLSGSHRSVTYQCNSSNGKKHH